MGVHGLTTYLRESRTVLSHTLVLPQHLVAKGPAVPFVVDAWSYVLSASIVRPLFANAYIMLDLSTK